MRRGAVTLPRVETAGLFPELLDGLVALLRGLSAEQWRRPTVAGSWDVKDAERAARLEGDAALCHAALGTVSILG